MPEGVDVEPSISAYVVLGLMARHGPMTPRELSARVEHGIAFFWPIPPARLHDEVARLAGAGLLAGETGGVFALTPAGERTLRAWLAAPGVPPADDGDPARVRLAFADLGEADDLIALARGQAARHEELLGDYQERRAAIDPADPIAESRSRVLELGIVHEGAQAAFWRLLATADDDDEGERDEAERPGAGATGTAATPGDAVRVPHYS